MRFEEPKVEFVKISNSEIVYASYNTGGSEMCIGTGSQCSVESMKENNQ